MTFGRFFNYTSPVRRFLVIALVIVLTVGGIFPFLTSRDVSAAQITSRSLTLGSGVPSAATTYTFAFSVPTTGTIIKSVSATACETAVGTCNTPTGFSVTGSTLPSQPTNLGDASGWTVNTATAGSLRLSKTTNATTPTNPITIFFGNVTNPSTANVSFFLRITTYSDDAWTTSIDTGTTASAVVQTLTVNAAVAEVLNFCTGTTTINDAIGDVTGGSADDCTGVSGTSINIGTLDTSAVNISPVSTNGGDSRVALAMLRTNAVNGATVSYSAIQQSGTNHLGTLRISGAVCDAGTTSTDQCINTAGTTQSSFAAGTEEFGMTIAGINCQASTSYSCTFSTGVYNLIRDTEYDGLGSNTYGSSTGTGFAWDETGTFDQIASSTGSATKVVDDEVLMMHFAATPAITTPFGVYAAQADFITVATY